MIGSIIGDIAGSIYEFANIKTKDFELFGPEAEFTDDSILTIATADALLADDLANVGNYYADYACTHPHPLGGYGNSFKNWVVRKTRCGHAPAYNSCGNGSAMRVGPVGWAFATTEETLAAARKSAECTHNHPEGIKGAQATALCIFMARHRASREEIRRSVEATFGYDLTMCLDELRPRYSWQGLDGEGNGETCQDSVPQAILCALQADDFEDAIRNAVSIGGDSDTIACITGSIAEAVYGIPAALRQKGLSHLTEDFRRTVMDFEKRFGHGLLPSEK